MKTRRAVTLRRDIIAKMVTTMRPFRYTGGSGSRLFGKGEYRFSRSRAGDGVYLSMLDIVPIQILAQSDVRSVRNG